MNLPSAQVVSAMNGSRKQGRVRDMELQDKSSRSLLANVLDLSDDLLVLSRNCCPDCHVTNHMTLINDGVEVGAGQQQQQRARTLSSSIGSSQHVAVELANIGREVRYLADKCRRDEATEEAALLWRHAARVIDRLCLLLFSIFNVTATAAILLSAPDLHL